MLEALIKELIEALNANTKAHTAGGACASHGKTATEATPPPAVAEEPVKKERKKKADAPAAETPAAPAESTPPPAESGEEEITADVIRAVAQEYLDKGGATKEIKAIVAAQGGTAATLISSYAGTEHAKPVVAALRKLIAELKD